MQSPLIEQLRDLRFQQRLDQASLVESHAKGEDRERIAAQLIRELAMQRIFEQLTKAQESELIERLWPLAHQDGSSPPALFGCGARSSTERTE